MKKIRRYLLAVLIIIVFIGAGIQASKYRKQSVDQLYAVSMAGDGRTLAAWYDDRNITVAMLDQNGKIQKYVTHPVEKGGHIYGVESLCADESGRAYVLVSSRDGLSGEYEEESLFVYDFGGWFVSKTEIPADQLQLPADGGESAAAAGWRYRWMTASGDVISVIGVNSDSTQAVRKVFEFGGATGKSINIKSEKVYSLAEGEGIYQAVGNGADLVYIARSGKVFRSSQTGVQEIYPAREVDTLMYPLYISYAETGYVYMGEGQSGDILQLNIEDGSETVLMSGSSVFPVPEIVMPLNICIMSMGNLNNFSAIIQGSGGSGYQLLVLWEGTGNVISTITRPISSLAGRFFLYLALYAVLAAAVILAGYSIFMGITKGRTIMSRLMLSALPLMVLTMLVFCVIAFRYYRDSLAASYEKQTVDEGNMMTALFGQESFNELAYPYDYGSESYTYLRTQMSSRELFSRVVYYEDGELYTGVDEESPCFYPIGILANSSLNAVYKEAALTGEAVSASVRDRFGERVITVTPVGGSSGRSVYLYETGVYTAVIEAYQSAYIRNFAVICAMFILVAAVLMTAIFLQVMQPLAEIKGAMETFALGCRDVRVEPTTRDELAGICKAFNKMADDFDLQIVNLQNLSNTYYRFMPMSVLGMLETENLSNLRLGSRAEGEYSVLSISLSLPGGADGLSLEEREEMTNQFYRLISAQAERQNAVSVSDGANMNNMLVICRDDVASAILMALAILAEVDARNARLEESLRMDIACLLHRSEIFVGICGDEEHYIPTVIAPDMERLLRERAHFAQAGARLLVTGEACRGLKSDLSFSNRYIGRLGMEDGSGFYEFYDDRGAEEMHLLKITDSSFRKAMKLFEEGYTYEAKNLFAMVLHDNPKDMAAKYYIFRCE